jgi:hypothetical protein
MPRRLLRTPEIAAIGVAVALVLGMLVREAACRHGLPYILYWDEYAVTGAALRMMQERSLDPEFYGYGALLTYITVLVELPVVAWLERLPPGDPRALESIAALQIGGMDGLGFGETSHPEVYYAARIVVAIMGVLTIATTAALAHRFAGPWAAVIAAFALSSAHEHVLQSGLAVPNVALALVATLVAWKTLDWLETGRGLHWAWALVGVATAFKPTGVLVAVLPFAAIVSARWNAPARPVSRSNLVAMVVLPVVVFLLVNPFYLYKPATVIHGVALEMKQYYGGLTSPFIDITPPGLPQLRANMGFIAESFGTLQVCLAAMGWYFLARPKHGWVVWLMPVAVTLFFITPNVSFHRNWLPAYPFLAIEMGVAAVFVARRVVRWPNTSIAWRLGVASLVIGDAVLNDVWYITHLARPDPRTVAIERLASSTLRVALPDEIRVHARDRAKLAHPVTGPLRNLACSDEADVIVLPPAFASWTPNETVSVLNAFLDVEVPPNSYAERLHFTLGPTGEVPALRAAALPIPGCEGFVPFEQLENLTSYPVHDSMLALLWNGPLALAMPTPPPGRYEVVWEVRGRTRDDENPRVRLGTPEGIDEVSLVSEWQLLEREFAVTDQTNMRSVTLEFVNDGSSPDTDRDVDLRRVWLRRI